RRTLMRDFRSLLRRSSPLRLPRHCCNWRRGRLKPANLKETRDCFSKHRSGESGDQSQRFRVMGDAVPSDERSPRAALRCDLDASDPDAVVRRSALVSDKPGIARTVHLVRNRHPKEIAKSPGAVVLEMLFPSGDPKESLQSPPGHYRTSSEAATQG